MNGQEINAMLADMGIETSETAARACWVHFYGVSVLSAMGSHCPVDTDAGGYVFGEKEAVALAAMLAPHVAEGSELSIWEFRLSYDDRKDLLPL